MDEKYLFVVRLSLDQVNKFLCKFIAYSHFKIGWLVFKKNMRFSFSCNNCFNGVGVEIGDPNIRSNFSVIKLFCAHCVVIGREHLKYEEKKKPSIEMCILRKPASFFYILSNQSVLIFHPTRFFIWFIFTCKNLYRQYKTAVDDYVYMYILGSAA